MLPHCAQLCPTLCDPRHCTLLDFSVHENSQAILEWVAISFSKESSQPRDQTWLSCVSCTDRQILYLLSHLGSPMEAEPLPEKHKPVLSRTGHNTQAFTPQSHSQIASSIFKKAYDAKTYTRSRDQGPSSLSLWPLSSWYPRESMMSSIQVTAKVLLGCSVPWKWAFAYFEHKGSVWVNSFNFD